VRGCSEVGRDSPIRPPYSRKWTEMDRGGIWKMRGGSVRRRPNGDPTPPVRRLDVVITALASPSCTTGTPPAGCRRRRRRRGPWARCDRSCRPTRCIADHGSDRSRHPWRSLDARFAPKRIRSHGKSSSSRDAPVARRVGSTTRHERGDRNEGTGGGGGSSLVRARGAAQLTPDTLRTVHPRHHCTVLTTVMAQWRATFWRGLVDRST
jgi:hypothetical protein